MNNESNQSRFRVAVAVAVVVAVDVVPLLLVLSVPFKSCLCLTQKCFATFLSSEHLFSGPEMAEVIFILVLVRVVLVDMCTASSPKRPACTRNRPLRRQKTPIVIVVFRKAIAASSWNRNIRQNPASEIKHTHTHTPAHGKPKKSATLRARRPNRTKIDTVIRKPKADSR